MNTTMTDKQLRELDGWIAEHAMGWKWVMHERPSQFAGKRWLLDPVHFKALIRHGWNWADMSLALLETNDIPHYSSDPAAAFAVWQRLLFTKGAFANVFEQWKSVEGDAFYLKLVAGVPEKFTVTAPTLELAICLAAQQLFQKKD